MKIWNKVKQPPKSALKAITGGRLKGMSDINPQWRYQVMTEHFGMCGVGWYYDIIRLWTEPASDDQVFAFAEIDLYIYVKERDGWSTPIPGIGGNMLVTKEKKGLHSSDEGFKMAVTDALGVAMKMLGVASDIYMGRWDGKDYEEEPEPIDDEQFSTIIDLISARQEIKPDIKVQEKFCKYFKISAPEELLKSDYDRAVESLT